MGRNAVRLCALAGVVAVGAWWNVGRASEEPRRGAARLSDLHWLVGTWHDPKTDGGTREHWFAPAGGAMVGVCRMGVDAARSMYELLLLEESDEGIRLSLRHFRSGLSMARGPDAIGMTLLKLESRWALFERTDGKERTRLTYERTSPQTLRCVLEKQRADKPWSVEFEFTRVGDDASDG